MDAQTLAQAMGRVPGVDYAAMLPHIEEAMRAASCTTPLRAAHFLAQVGHESAGLRYMEEIASGAAYEGRADLGNTRPGDGRRFKGRGPIQLTGRANYRAFTRWAQNAGHTTHDFEANPHLLSQPEWGFLAASYYWTVARPDLNSQADRDDLEAVTRSINGGLNGLADRRQRLHRCKQLGPRLLPTPRKENLVAAVEKVLPYSRQWVTQNTGYYCGPASVQTVILSKAGRLEPESKLAGELRTHAGGTDYIGQFPTVLNRHLPGAGYRHQDMPNDPPTPAQRDKLWRDITGSINAGYGVVANIVAPPGNYPRAVAPSTINPAYRGGTVYHYIAVMGYAGAGSSRRVWVADSGFYPYGYWLSLSQLATLIPPKGYAYATAKPAPKPALKQAPKKKEAPKVDKAQADRIERLLTLILDQLVGPEKDQKGWKFSGWQQTGGKTLVDAVADIRNALTKEDK